MKSWSSRSLRSVMNHDGRVFHGRLADDGPGVKGHGQALARPLGVPDHTDAPVANGSAAWPSSRFISCRFPGPEEIPLSRLQIRRPQRLTHSGAGQRGTGGTRPSSCPACRCRRRRRHDDSRGAEPEERSGRQIAFQHHLQLGQKRIGQGLRRLMVRQGLNHSRPAVRAPMRASSAVGKHQDFVH